MNSTIQNVKTQIPWNKPSERNFTMKESEVESATTVIVNYLRIQTLISNEETARNEILPMLISLLECGEEDEWSLTDPMAIKETLRLLRATREYMIRVEQLTNILKHEQDVIQALRQAFARHRIENG
jgi:hypothetical protein